MNEAHDIIGKFMAEVVNEEYDSYLDTDNTDLTELQKVPADYELYGSQIIDNNQPNVTIFDGSSDSSTYNTMSNEEFALSEVEKKKIKSLLDRWNMRYLFQTFISE